MTNSPLTLFCLVDGQSTSKAFPVSIPSAESVGELKKHIKVEKAPRFDDLAADELTLWRVSIPVVPADKHKPIVLDEVDSATDLDPTDDVFDNFSDKPPKKAIYNIVQRPPPGNTVCVLPPEAIQAITERLVGRFRLAVTDIEKAIARNEPGGWKVAVDDT
ncbi:hypothetical protein BG015_003122, partial [Linnemannia schmuckeri]